MAYVCKDLKLLKICERRKKALAKKKKKKVTEKLKFSVWLHLIKEDETINGVAPFAQN